MIESLEQVTCYIIWLSQMAGDIPSWSYTFLSLSFTSTSLSFFPLLFSSLQYTGLATHVAEGYSKRRSLRNPYASLWTLLGPQKHGNQLYSTQKPLKKECENKKEKNSDIARVWIGNGNQVTLEMSGGLEDVRWPWGDQMTLGAGQVIRNADTICNRQGMKE